MTVRDNLEKMIRYLHGQPQPASLARVVAAGVMNSSDAYEAARYGVRHGVIGRIERPGARSNERVWYRWTGQAVPPARNGRTSPSFDDLLTAWSIPNVPPCLPPATSTRTVCPIKCKPNDTTYAACLCTYFYL